MQDKRLLYYAFSLVVTLAVLHFLAMSLYLYWTLWWFDILTHFLGGLAIGLFVVWIFSKLSASSLVWSTILTVLIIGVGWEIFEYVYDIGRSLGESYSLDTVLDLVMDTLGAYLATRLAPRLKSS